jgi:hypothetical protein
MGPLADYRQAMNSSPAKQQLRWLDNMQDDKDKLRTNNSQDDLVCKEEVSPIVTHKKNTRTNPIIKQTPYPPNPDYLLRPFEDEQIYGDDLMFQQEQNELEYDELQPQLTGDEEML